MKSKNRFALALAAGAMGLAGMLNAGWGGGEKALAAPLVEGAPPAGVAAQPAAAPKIKNLRLLAGGLPGAIDKPVTLLGSDARLQLVAIAQDLATGEDADLTRQVKYEIAPAGVLLIDGSGFVVPLANGQATVTALGPDGQRASASVKVEQFNNPPSTNFTNEVVPIFTKYGCNGGGCHGKSGGQNGFRLGLLGFEPAEDYEYVVKESRGRRLFPTAPDRSLLLLKATGAMPHGGGSRLKKDSQDYRVLRRWITQGMPYGNASDAMVDRIEVVPASGSLRQNQGQQVSVTAIYSDGRRQDVTRTAQYEVNDDELGQVDENGLVTAIGKTGDISVMVRFNAKVGVYQAVLPMGAPMGKMPPERNFIDALVFKKLVRMGLPPSEICDDSTFIRRVTLDITGRLPTIEETRAFLADKDAARRDKLIDRLLESPDYADFFAAKWNALFRNKRDAATQMRGSFAFHAWIRQAINQNMPYDQFVRQVVAASGEIGQSPSIAWYRQVDKREELVEDTAQLFLGQRLQCARCHHHPHERWSQKDYYSFSAFFSTTKTKAGDQPGESVLYHAATKASAVNPKDGKPVGPEALGSGDLNIPREDDPRHALVDWMTGKENRFFAHSLANRYFKHFMGRGLIEPEDDMRATNPATNPELLNAMARHFIDSGFDMKDLIRVICRSTTYQLSALPNEHNRIDKQNYARYYPKRLPAEVLLDSVNRMLGASDDFPGLPIGTRAVELPDNTFNASSYFLMVFGRPDMNSACECERSGEASLAQSLHLMNSPQIMSKLTAAGGAAAKLAETGPQADEEKIANLYLTVFSRPPSADELARAMEHLARAQKSDPAANTPKTTAADKRQAYEDILWALLGTKEFSFNH